MPSNLVVEVCKVESISLHPNADRLELATVKGWQCVVQKGKFKAGDKVVYLPIDSVLSGWLKDLLFPPDSKVNLKNNRIRTIKLRGQVSQGMIIPLESCNLLEETTVGTDVMGLLGITKYVSKEKLPNALAGGKQASTSDKNGYFKKYTAIPHLNNFDKVLKGEDVIVTEKIHGTNWRCGYTKRDPVTWWDRVKDFFCCFDDIEFVYGSHNVQLQRSKGKQEGAFASNVYERIADLYRVQDLLDIHYPGEDIVFYGEVYGSGIQKNYSYGCKEGEVRLVIFDVMRDGEYLDYADAQQICSFLELPFLEPIWEGKFDKDELVKVNKGNSLFVPEQEVMEGVVVRKKKEEYSACGGRQRSVFKFINPKYLLNKDNTEWS